MAKQESFFLGEAADRLAIRELIRAYARCADRRDFAGQMALFTEDAHFVGYMNANDLMPSIELHSREALAAVFADLNQHAATTHCVGRSNLSTLTEDTWVGETCCLVYRVTFNDGAQRLTVASIRYLDIYMKVNGVWLFAERRLYVDWQQDRTL
jgi:hypothetical protein